MTLRAMVIGGARSGKSTYAEKLVIDLGKPLTYIATAQAFDAEMQDRITMHQKTRGVGWHTLEVPLKVAEALGEIPADQTVLLDCATLWLTNHLLAENDTDAAIDALLGALDTFPCDIAVVTNEVGQGIVPDNALSRQFRDAQGRLNQQFGAWSNLAVLVTAGLPLALKGTLP